MTERKRPSIALISIIVVVLLLLPVLYFASFGPLTYFVTSGRLDESSTLTFYTYPAEQITNSGYGLANRIL